MEQQNGVMAEFTVKEERKGDKSRTVLYIHNNITIAKSKWRDVYTNKNYEDVFVDTVKKILEE